MAPNRNKKTVDDRLSHFLKFPCIQGPGSIIFCFILGPAGPGLAGPGLAGPGLAGPAGPGASPDWVRTEPGPG